MSLSVRMLGRVSRTLRGLARTLAAGVVAAACAPVLAVEPAAAVDGSNAALERLTVLAYHDVVDTRGADSDPDAVTQRELVEQLQWLRTAGFEFVSLQQVLDAGRGRGELPKRALLLTFDDGYRSFHARVLPMLRLLRLPAVAAVVGAWMQPDAQGRVQVDGVSMPADRFMTPAQVREVAASGLVEVVSHTWGQHKSIVASPQGSRIPAVVARGFDTQTSTYEEDAAYRRRLQEDFERNAQYIEKLTGQRPRALVWPYGRYNGPALQAALQTGHLVTLSLDELEGGGAGLPLGRRYVTGSPTLKQFAADVRRQRPPQRAYRYLALALGDFVASAAVPDDEVVGSVLDVVARSGANAVLLDPYSSDCGAWFAGGRNVERDLLTRAVWQLRVRSEVGVFLDLDLDRCVDPKTAVREVRTMSQLGAFDGIVLRGPPGARSLAGELTQAFLAERPGRAVISSLDVAARTAELMSLSACDPRDSTTGAASGLPRWVENVFGPCRAAPRLGETVRRDAASWGVRLGEAAPANHGTPVIRDGLFVERTVRPLLLGVLPR